MNVLRREAAVAVPESLSPGSRALARTGPVATWRQLPDEWLELSYAIETLRVNKNTVVVQFVGASGTVGTTTVASGFARAAGQAAIDHAPGAGAAPVLPVLFIDCSDADGVLSRRDAGKRRPESLVEAFRRDAQILEPIVPAQDAVGVAWARLGATAAGATRCGPAEMERLFNLLRERFSLIVLDCPAVSRGVGALSLAPHCDGTLVVLRAAVTRAEAVKSARERIERVGGQVIGTVFNRVPRRSGWLSRQRDR